MSGMSGNTGGMHDEEGDPRGRGDGRPAGPGRVGDEENGEPDPDLDAEVRAEALYFVFRRTAIWAIPLTIVGALLVALGIPLWISVIAMVLVLAMLVFEVEI